MTYNHNDFLYDLAKDDPKIIQQMVQPSMELIEMMILNGWFEYFPEEWKNEAVQMAAVKQNGYAIQVIKNPTQKVKDYVDNLGKKG